MIQCLTISVLPVPCFNCKCHWCVECKSQIFDCRGTGLKEIPKKIPTKAEWLIFSGNNITKGCADLSFLPNAYHLELQDNYISELCVDMIKPYNYVDVSNNKISKLPQSITQVSNMSLMLGSNPYKCDCDIFWMSEWLINATTLTPIIKDYENIKCMTGKNKGQKIITLTQENMDCIQPPIVAIIVPCLIVIALVILILLIFRHYDSIKFFFFLKYNIRMNEDHMEDVNTIEFDALIAYRLVSKRYCNIFHRASCISSIISQLCIIAV